MRPKIGLALGGGGARGFAHIGTLKVLEEHRIPIDIIVGSSMGAIIGGAYSLRPDAKLLEKRVLTFSEKKTIKKLESLAAKDEQEERMLIFKKLATFVTDVYLWNLTAIKGCIIEAAQIEEIIRDLVDKKDFSQTKIRFASVATDINTGKQAVFTEGDLCDAIYASSAIPGVFPPKQIKGQLLIDGGIVNLMPADCAKSLGAEIVIGIDVDMDIKPKHFKHGYDIIFRADDIRRHELNLLKMKNADIIISPEVKNLSWAHFSRAVEAIEKGEEATRLMIPSLKRKTKKINLISRFKSFFNNLGKRQGGQIWL